jgi:hypothetical protein
MSGQPYVPVHLRRVCFTRIPAYVSTNYTLRVKLPEDFQKSWAKHLDFRYFKWYCKTLSTLNWFEIDRFKAILVLSGSSFISWETAVLPYAVRNHYDLATFMVWCGGGNEWGSLREFKERRKTDRPERADSNLKREIKDCLCLQRDQSSGAAPDSLRVPNWAGVCVYTRVHACFVRVRVCLQQHVSEWSND